MNELKVGFLSLLALASIVVVSLKITSNTASFGEFIEYRTILNDATGIYEDSTIKVAGITAGRIKTIVLSGSQALITFEVLEGIKITSFSRLRVKSVGFLGDKYIDIYLGNPNAQRLKAGSMILAETGAGLEQLGKDASDILKDIKVITKLAKEALYTKNEKNALKEIMAEIHSFSKNANDISKAIARLVDVNEKKVSNTLSNLEKMSEQLAFETDRYRDGSFMNDLEALGPIMAKVDSTVSDLRDIMADVKAGKGTVGKLLRDEDVIDKVSETLSSVNKIVGRINNYKTDISIYSGFNDKQGSKTDVYVDLIPSPERFFRFGVVVGDGTSLSRDTITTRTIDGGIPVVTVDEEVEDTAYRFNLQVGRKVNRYTFRVGLFESKGGLGVDYSFPEYGIKSSLEAFDHREDIGMNLKISTSVRVWNVVYAKLSAEDLGRSSEFHVYTLSAGLNFTDDDLASLIGFAL